MFHPASFILVISGISAILLDDYSKTQTENNIRLENIRMDDSSVKAKSYIYGFVRNNTYDTLKSDTIVLFKDGSLHSSTLSDEKGNYRFSGLAAGNYQIKVNKTGYFPWMSEAIRLNDDSAKRYPIMLVPLAGQKVNDQISLLKSGTTMTSSSEMRKTGLRNPQSFALQAVGTTATKSGLKGRGSRSDNSNTQDAGYGIIRSSEKNRRKKTADTKYYDYGSEEYADLIENEYIRTANESVSTFSIDVDNASYTNSRRYINSGLLPPKNAVRIEEFINYFDYSYPQPESEQDISMNMETASCPWNPENRIVQIGLKAKDIETSQMQKCNLVFLIDVSGSMYSENKLPLVKSALKTLIKNLRSDDRISIVTYAGAAGLALNSTECSEQNTIIKAIDKLNAGGSTAGGEGIILAYKVAKDNFISEGNNRIILVTDGDFNVGVSGDAELKELIEEKRKDKIFLTVCGFGTGNYKDSKMETLADYGNGNYYYIDNQKEADRIFAKGLSGVIMTMAKDVKIQVEFNPKFVQAYRLIGYENRKLNNRDFTDDAKDAGEMGAGQTVTALYEIIPVGVKMKDTGFIELKYHEKTLKLNDYGEEMMTLKIRYKKPESNTSISFSKTLDNNVKTYLEASSDFRFACGITLFGMLLRDSKFKENGTYELAKSMILNANIQDTDGKIMEVQELIDKVMKLKG